MTDRPTSLPDRDISARLCEQVGEAHERHAPLRIVGGDTRAFYGRPVEADPLDIAEHRGIIHYDPVELIVTARAGTPLEDLEAALAEHHQMLSFEPPRFGPQSTLGGAVASGMAGPRRPWAGATRDLVLGTRVITQQGKLLRFGGEVIKNVAGYDMSRLMTGAQGTLGVLADVSFKVLPRPAAHCDLRLAMPLDEALSRLARLGRRPLPITAAAWYDGELLLRLEGGRSSVDATRQELGGETLEPGFWQALRDLRHDFFTLSPGQSLWRLSLPPNTAPLTLDDSHSDTLYDWAGCQRFVKTSLEDEAVRRACSAVGGHATCYTPAAQGGSDAPFTPLHPVVEKHHRRLKEQLDARGIFNPGRLYAAF